MEIMSRHPEAPVLTFGCFGGCYKSCRLPWEHWGAVVRSPEPVKSCALGPEGGRCLTQAGLGVGV